MQNAIDKEDHINALQVAKKLYVSSTENFDVIDIDVTLGIASSIPQSFVDLVKSEIDVENLSLDGGEF